MTLSVDEENKMNVLTHKKTIGLLPSTIHILVWSFCLLFGFAIRLSWICAIYSRVFINTHERLGNRIFALFGDAAPRCTGRHLENAENPYCENLFFVSKSALVQLFYFKNVERPIQKET